MKHFPTLSNASVKCALKRTSLRIIIISEDKRSRSSLIHSSFSFLRHAGGQEDCTDRDWRSTATISPKHCKGFQGRCKKKLVSLSLCHTHQTKSKAIFCNYSCECHRTLIAFDFLFLPSSQIKLKEIFETPAEISLVLELVTGGELFDRFVYASPYNGDVIHPHKHTSTHKHTDTDTHLQI